MTRSNLIVCDGCGNILREGQSFYVITQAHVTQNDNDGWDYERDTDDSVWCIGCAEKLPLPAE